MTQEQELEIRIKILMKKYVCHKHKECHKPCIYDSNNDQHLCDLSGYGYIRKMEEE